MGGRHSVVGQRGSWRPRLPSDVLQDFVGHFIDKKSSYDEGKCSRTRRKSISYEKNAAKIWEEGKESCNKASGVIGGVERHKRKVKMGETTQMLSKLKILCRISITRSCHYAIVYQAADFSAAARFQTHRRREGRQDKREKGHDDIDIILKSSLKNSKCTVRSLPVPKTLRKTSVKQDTAERKLSLRFFTRQVPMQLGK